MGEFWGRIEEGQQGREPDGDGELCQVAIISDGADGADEVEDDVEGLMAVCPLDAAGGACGARGKVPVKVIAAHGGEEGESEEVGGWGDAQQEAAGLPDHQHGADGNVDTAEDNEIG